MIYAEFNKYWGLTLEIALKLRKVMNTKPFMNVLLVEVIHDNVFDLFRYYLLKVLHKSLSIRIDKSKC